MNAPGWQAWFVLALLAVVVTMFAREKPRVDLAALLGVAALILARILTPEQAFAGFGSPVIITLASVFVLGGALQATGVLDVLGAWVVRRLGQGELALTLGLMALAAALSAVMNNTTVTAMLTPLTVGLALKAGLSPSRLLMPIAFASILGGTCTLIGTSTNLAVSGFIAQQAGLAPIGLFEITPVGLILVASGMLLLGTVGRALLPRPAPGSLADAYDIRDYLSEIVVMPGSRLVGQAVAESDLARMEFRILKIIRRGRALVPDADTRLETKDLLLVRGDVAALMKVKQTEGTRSAATSSWATRTSGPADRRSPRWWSARSRR
ncbi:MAG: SLC13 family permease [Limisphaerales bacterium]